MAFDVFISFKNTDGKGGLTQDRMIAERLHSALKREGLEVFFSERDLDNAVFIREINNALEEARMLILVGTTSENVRSKWVEAEWSSFMAMINSGRKPNGQMITVLQGMTTNDLPPMISSLQSFDALDIDGVVRFVFKALGRVSLSEAAEYEKKQKEEELRKAEEERLRAIAAQMQAERDAQRAADEAAKAAEAADRERKAREQTTRKAKRSIGWIVAAAVLVVVAAVAVIYGISYNTPRTVVVDGVEYSVYEGQATVVSCDKEKSGEFVIPSRIKGNRVNIIGHSAFRDCDSLTDIIIPDSVTTIGDRAFYDCDSLTDITVPDSVTTIGGATFYSCNNLNDITIPDSLTAIGDYAFCACDSLTSITIPESVTSIGDGAFSWCESLTSITIPNSVTSIEDHTFNECRSLTSITIPDSVTSIGYGAFLWCESLTSITIPNSVTSIGVEAFSFCESLTSITVPDSVIYIGRNAFYSYYSYYHTITIKAPHDPSYYGYAPTKNETWTTP